MKHIANMESTKWTTVRVTTPLVDEIEKLLKQKKYSKYGFTGTSSFVTYLIRKEIDDQN
tara:strand:- start:308 stop:484 length:177 start_codon:yes stop_codon:yes gene_type:complete